VAELADALDL